MAPPAPGGRQGERWGRGRFGSAGGTGFGREAGVSGAVEQVTSSFPSIKRIGVNGFSELLLLLMNNLFAIFAEARGLGFGLKAQFD